MNNPNIKDVISDMIDQGFRIGKKPEKEDEVNENNLHVNFKLAEEINNMADFVLFHPEKNALIELYTNENDELVRGNAVANISFSSMSNNVEDLMKKIENTTHFNTVTFKGENYTGNIQRNLSTDIDSFMDIINDPEVTNNKIPFDKNTMDLIESMKGKTSVDYQMQAQINSMVGSKGLTLFAFQEHYKKDLKLG